MKVVLFCGGLGTRLRDYSETIPKPMVAIGYRPILWHLMKYYAHFGFKEFILCLGYRADTIKKYFINYDECISNDFTLSKGGAELELASSDIHDWKITFVDTGLKSNIGQRLKAIEKQLGDDEFFLANYSDGLSDLPLLDYVDSFKKSGKVASFVSVKPNQSFHVVSLKNGNDVESIQELNLSGIWINGGFFAFRREIFDYIQDGEELVREPFERLIAENKLSSYPYEGFWTAMDTFKDKQRLEDMYMAGETPWEVWREKDEE